jgi:Carbohydrate family 9 binding domain-like
MCALPGVAQDVDPEKAPGVDTLFLTWFEDPTTSIVAQWLEEGDLLVPIKGASDDVPAFDVPRVEGVTIDGEADDWEGRGLDAGFLAGSDGEVYGAGDLSVEAKLGWDERGLVVMVRVRDDVADESDDVESLWSADSVEFFVSTGVGSDQRYQVLVSPGADKQRGGAQQWFYDYRRDRSGGEPTFEYACVVDEGGYRVELLLPWANLGIDPKGGETIGFQFYVNDRDGGDNTKKTVWWQTDNDANERPESMYAVRLSEQAGVGAVARAKVVRDGDKAELVVWAGAGLAGQKVKATSARQVIGEAVLREQNGGSSARIELEAAPQGSRWGMIHAEVDGEKVAYARPMKWMMVKQPEPVRVTRGRWVMGATKGLLMTGASETSTVKPFGDYSGLFVHRVEFRGLEPGGEYVLRVGGMGEAHRFRTAPATLEEPVVFADGGDLGTSEYVGALHRQAAGWRPLFGLIGGDAAYGNGRTPERWVDFLRIWRENMVDPDGRLIPMLPAIGNHEVDGSFDQPREKAPYFLALFDGLYPEKSYAAVDFGDYLSLVLLDSGHLNAHGGEQARWLEEVLAARVDRPNLFTAYHVPAYPSHRKFEGKRSTQARLHWVPLFDRYGVDVSFEHHDHTYKRTYRLTGGERDADGVLYMGDGCWGMAPRTVVSLEENPYLRKAISSRHVIRVTLDGEGREFMAVDDQGRVIDRYEMGRE